MKLMSEPEIHIEKKRVNRWKLFGLLLLSSTLMLLYVSNVLYVDAQLEEMQSMKKIYKSVKNGNELLKTEIIKLESADRIIPYAEKELGMLKPDRQPRVLQFNDSNTQE